MDIKRVNIAVKIAMSIEKYGTKLDDLKEDLNRIMSAMSKEEYDEYIKRML